MGEGSPWQRWGSLTPAERRILAWVVGLLLLGVVAREVHHRQAGPAIPQKVEGSASLKPDKPL